MDVLVIAQLITGIATLVVASVLIWQMIIQKKALDIAHNDADANMSLQAMESRSEQKRWFADKVSDEMIERLEKGYEFLTKKEQFFIKTNTMNHGQILATEWRLKRVNRNIGYYKQTIRNHMMLEDFKACRDYFELNKEMRVRNQNYSTKLDSSIGDTKPLVDPNFHKIGEEVYEELTGKELGA